jgi:hypothetical protein
VLARGPEARGLAGPRQADARTVAAAGDRPALGGWERAGAAEAAQAGARHAGAQDGALAGRVVRPSGVRPSKAAGAAMARCGSWQAVPSGAGTRAAGVRTDSGMSRVRGSRPCR